MFSDHPEFKLKVSRIAEVINASGIPAEKAGDIVFEAIKDNTFYILTDTDPFWKNMIKERMNGIFQAFKKI
ncbi:hypothetical protein LCGC14_1197900 [marine sediment metagenome]|uniref:Uncharacterized protein n=1 Tax=marine sediment metagenome TaxID=412755 RepID=A0A0F9P090_9ZZZZ|nr:MAG: hypothetical protein Lokiarch_01760 [Candidatus Lokiarchaeum sp. GC14_75]